LSFSVSAQLQVVEIKQPQFARSVAGIVVDPSGAALPGVIVEERTEDWKTVLRSTKTDDNGNFHFASSRNKIVYHLYFSHSGFDWLQINLELHKKAKSPLVIKMPIAT
jgi:hypothetical protein